MCSNETTINKIACVAFLLLFGVNGLAYASELEEQRKALDMIAEFAERLCTTVPLEEGRTGNLELSGSAKVELNKLIRKIVDLGIEGAAKYKTEEWQGVLQKDLPRLLKDNIECKIEVWKDLKDKLVVIGTKPASTAKIERLVIEDDFERYHHWSVHPNHPSVKTYYAYGGYVVENVTRNLSALQGFWKLGVVQSHAKIELTLSQLTGTTDQPFGLMFGATDSKFRNAYTFGLRSDGIYMVDYWVDNKQQKFIQWRPDPIIRTGLGQKNRLKLEINGRTITYYINDKQLGNYTADNEVTGFIGVYLNWPGMKAVYDDLKVVEYSNVNR